MSLFAWPRSPVALAQVPFSEESATKTDLREAIFRYLFKKYDYGPGVKVLCIKPDRPLPESFLRRFADSKLPVIWISDCDNSGPMNSMREKKTGYRALLVSIHVLQFLDGDQAQAEVEVFSDGIAANSNTLTLVRKENRWSVKSDKLTSVS